MIHSNFTGIYVGVVCNVFLKDILEVANLCFTVNLHLRKENILQHSVTIELARIAERMYHGDADGTEIANSSFVWTRGFMKCLWDD